MNEINHIDSIEKYLNKNISKYDKFSGRDFDVFIVEDLVFRFPRSRIKRQDIINEKNILNIIRPYITLQIPNYEICDDFIVYPLIRGNILGNDKSKYSQKIISQLVEFMQQLHSIPLDNFSKEEKYPKSEVQNFVEELKKDIDKKLFDKISTDSLKNIYNYIDELFIKYECFKKALSTMIYNERISSQKTVRLVE